MPLVDQLFESLHFEVTEFWAPLAKEFNQIEIFCVYGNHGRGMGKKGQYHIRTNWDYVYYRCLKMVLEKMASHIKVYVSESPSMIVQHGNFLFCYKHGDDVKSWLNIPFYGLDRMANRFNTMVNTVIDYYCVAHSHQPVNINNRIIVNGTLVGGSTLSINRLSSSSIPNQKMFYLHPKHGIHRETNLFLDEVKQIIIQENDDNNSIVLTPVSDNNPK